MRTIPTFALLALLSAAPGRTAEQTLTLSPGEATVSFALDATAHTVHGTIPVASGTIRLDEATGRIAGEVVLDLKKADTGNARRDRSMHAEVLETAKFPTAVFHPVQLQGALRPAGTSEVTLTGNLQLHGGEHRVEIPLKVTRSGSHLTADGLLTIPYVKWGLKDPSAFVLRVGKTVDVTVHVAGELKLKP